MRMLRVRISFPDAYAQHVLKGLHALCARIIVGMLGTVRLCMFESVHYICLPRPGSLMLLPWPFRSPVPLLSWVSRAGYCIKYHKIPTVDREGWKESYEGQKGTQPWLPCLLPPPAPF